MISISIPCNKCNCSQLKNNPETNFCLNCNHEEIDHQKIPKIYNRKSKNRHKSHDSSKNLKILLDNNKEEIENFDSKIEEIDIDILRKSTLKRSKSSGKIFLLDNNTQ